MKKIYEIVDIKNLLFVFDIENTHDIEREQLIAEKDVNDSQQLTELIDTLLKPEFYEYRYRAGIPHRNSPSFFDDE